MYSQLYLHILKLLQLVEHLKGINSTTCLKGVEEAVFTCEEMRLAWDIWKAGVIPASAASGRSE